MDEARRRFAALNLAPKILRRRIDTRCSDVCRKALESNDELETMQMHRDKVRNPAVV
jgi:hypothetical protein